MATEISMEELVIDANLVLAANDNTFDMNQQEIKNFVVHKVTNLTMPASPTNGQIIYNTDKKKFGFYQDGAWTWHEALPAIIGDQHTLLGVNEAGTALEYKSINGTAKQVIIKKDPVTGAFTFSLPQSIANDSTVQFNTVKISSSTPVDDKDAINYGYLKQKIDEVKAGFKARTTCAAASTANLTYPFTGTPIIDGYQTVVGDRILIKNQTTQSQNGVYVVPASGNWQRATDFDEWSEYAYSYVFVEYGTTNGDTGFACDAVATGTLETSNITYTVFNTIGKIEAGDGIKKELNKLSVLKEDTTLKFDTEKLAVFLDTNGALTSTVNGIKLNIDSAFFEIVGNVLKLRSGVGVAEQTIAIEACTKDTLKQINHTLGKVPKSIQFYKTTTRSMVIPEIVEVTSTYLKVKFHRNTTAGEISVDLMAGK